MTYCCPVWFDKICEKGGQMKIDRLIGILSILLQKEMTTAPELADHFEVSRRTINRDIEDLCKAGIPIRFYRDVLGFEIKEEENTSNVYLVKDGTLFLLYGRKDFEKMTSRRYEYIKGLNGHFEIALYVDTFEEVDEAYKKAVENGATSVLEPELEPWGQRTCYIADPEGNLIEIGSWNKSYETKDLTEG